jgi:hypothetical protein
VANQRLGDTLAKRACTPIEHAIPARKIHPKKGKFKGVTTAKS